MGEPRAVDVARQDRLYHAAAVVGTRRGDRHLGDVQRAAGLRHHVEAVADVGRRGDPTDAGIAEREAHAVVGVKKVHLAADDVDLRAFVIEILHLREEIGADVVVVDGEVGLGREGRLRVQERMQRIVARHEPVVRLPDRKPRPRLAVCPPVDGRLVDDIPAVDNLAEFACNVEDALAEDLRHAADESRRHCRDLSLGERLVRARPAGAPVLVVATIPVVGLRKVLGVATRNANGVERALLAFGTVPVVDPVRLGRAPDEDVAVDRHSARLEVVDGGRRRGTAPVRMLHCLGARKRIPEPRGVLVVAKGAEAPGHGLVLAPVERDGRLVEDATFAVARLVGGVPLVAAELVVVEDVRAEAEGVADLLDLHLRAVRRGDFERCVGLAVRLDFGVDLRLDLVVPDAPVLLAHRRAVDLEFRLGGQGKCKRNSCRQCRLHFVAFHVLLLFV